MHRQALQLLSWLEGLLAIGWIIMMAFGQARGTSQYRTAIFFLLFHFAFSTAPLAWASHKYMKWKKNKRILPLMYMFPFMFAIAVDINNLLETVLYLPRDNSLWVGMITLSSVALALSVFAWLWYLTLATQHNGKMTFRLRTQPREEYTSIPEYIKPTSRYPKDTRYDY